jgi:hypothetical protein
MLRLTRSFKTVKGWEADSQDFLVRVPFMDAEAKGQCNV